jgi:hypothetical protein
LSAYNINGATLSPTAGFVFASIPSTPTEAVALDLTHSSVEQLYIVYNAIASNGGSPILSYSLEIDNGRGGAFTCLYGDFSDTMILSFIYKNIERGL